MATVFNTDFKLSIVPKEVTDLSDGADTCTHINSNIDKVIGSNITMADIGDYGINANANGWHDYINYTLTASFVDLSTIFSGDTSDYISKIVVIIREAAGTGTSGCSVELNAGAATFALLGVGDFLVIPWNGSAEFLEDEIKLKTPNLAINGCNVDIYIHGEA